MSCYLIYFVLSAFFSFLFGVLFCLLAGRRWEVGGPQRQDQDGGGGREQLKEKCCYHHSAALPNLSVGRVLCCFSKVVFLFVLFIHSIFTSCTCTYDAATGARGCESSPLLSRGSLSTTAPYTQRPFTTGEYINHCLKPAPACSITAEIVYLNTSLNSSPTSDRGYLCLRLLF